ncbi:hypothetical protein BT69DRAFT_1329743 [Atractiella rhizophila]|nr:hypothetical protein BT69DRAFT_1329743 [Atractiella rhizophila]
MSDKELKRILKESRALIASQDWQSLEQQTSANLSTYLTSYPLHLYHALSLSSIATTSPQKVIRAYEDAIAISPRTLQAYLGLSGWLEKNARLEDAQDVRERAVRMAGTEENEKERWAKEVDVWLTNERKLRSGRKLADSLSLLLPSSPISHLLSSLPPPNPTAPTASAYHNLQTLLLNTFPLLLEIIFIYESADAKEIESEVTKRRQRITTGPTLSKVEERRNVLREVKGKSKVVDLYRELLDHPLASDEERKEVEAKLLKWKMEMLDATPEKEERERENLREEISKMAREMVLLKREEQSAWKVVFDWEDWETIYDTPDRLQLWDYITLFPESGLTKLLKAYMRIYDVVSYEYGAEKDEDDVPEDIEDPVDLLEEGFAASTDSLLAHRLALRYYSEDEQDWEVSIEIIESGISLIGSIERESAAKLASTRHLLSRKLAICLAQSGRSNQLKALRLLDESLSMAEDDLECLAARGRVLVQLSRWNDGLEIFERAARVAGTDEVKEGRGWCLVQLERYEEGLEDLKAVVAALEGEAIDVQEERVGKLPETKVVEMKREKLKEKRSLMKARVLWKLGKCYWGMGGEYLTNTDYTFQAFVSSIRATPTFAPSFTSLGIYYADIISPPDFSRSSKCFQKAFELDPSEEIAAKRLAEQFAEENEWDLVEVVARRITENANGRPMSAKDAWAWKAIGSVDLKKKRYNEASVAFQSVLRVTPTDAHTWLKLGISYRHSGKFVAALKSFGRAIELDSLRWYAKFCIGETQRYMGLLDSSIATFEEVVTEHPDEFGVHLILAETRVVSGQTLFQQGFLARAEEAFVLALREGTKILLDGVESRIAWKIVGDALHSLATFEEQALRPASLGCISSLLPLLQKDEIDSQIPSLTVVTLSTVQELLQPDREEEGAVEDSASTFVFIAASVMVYKLRVLLEYHNDSIGSAWFDLGQAVFRCQNQEGIEKEKTVLQAIQCIQSALQKEPSNAGFWNALGVFAFDESPRLSQHSFIRAIELSSRSAVAWTNLGFFYIHHSDLQLANQAFLRAQVLDPDHSLAWVGQSIVARLNGEEDQSLALAAHAISLGRAGELDLIYPESTLASSSSSASAFQISETMTTSLFSLTRYISLHPTNPTALHLQGLLSESVSSLPDAKRALSRAASLLETEYEKSEDPAVEKKYAVCMYNLGRVLVRSQSWEEAIETLEGAEGLLEDKEGMENVLRQCRLFLGLARAGAEDKEGAREALDAALEGSEGIVKTELTVGYAHGLWRMDELDEAKSVLLDAPKESKEDPADTFAFMSDRAGEKERSIELATTLAAMAISTEDEVLLKASIKDLTSLPSHLKAVQDPTQVADRLMALHAVSTHDISKASALLSSALHRFPSSISLRLAIARVRMEEGKGEEAEGILPPIDHESISEDMTKEEMAEILRLRASIMRGKGQEEESLRCAQKAARLRPGDEENWSSLRI